MAVCRIMQVRRKKKIGRGLWLSAVLLIKRFEGKLKERIKYMKIRVSGIVEESIVDGPGIRYTIFTQGCNHDCKGCHNPDTHDFAGGSIKECSSIVNEFKENFLLDGITLSGGEPFLQPTECTLLAQEARKIGLNVVTYTGYTFEELYLKAERSKEIMELLRNTDILVDGPFIQEQRNILLKFRGSENQRIIDVKKTLNKYKRVEENEGKNVNDILLYEFEEE